MAGIGLKGRKVVVLGLNPSGVSLARFLVRRGALLTLVDPRSAEVVNPIIAEVLDVTKFTLECGDFNPKTFEETQTIVVTPGMPLDLKVLESARALGVPVMSELEFVSLYCEEPIIAIAGTNGKSTTAALLAKILEHSGKTVFAGIEQPLAEYLNRAKAADYVIAIANAFQIEGISQFKTQMILMLNLSEDHANRYLNFESYVATNRELFKNSDENLIVIANSTDPNVAALVTTLPGRKMFFGGTQALAPDLDCAWGDKNSVTLQSKEAGGSCQLSLKNFRPRGAHNRENLMAAGLAALALGGTQEAIQKTVDEISALPHRVEFVRRINSVAFYNDSCGANVQAVVRTLQAFHEPIILISGGRDKNADYTPLIPHIRQRVKNLILVGEAKEKFNRAVGDFTETFLVGTMEEAVLLAYQKSRSGDVILLSPGCDSTDSFLSHEDRGEHFKKLVTMIAQPRRPNVI